MIWVHHSTLQTPTPNAPIRQAHSRVLSDYRRTSQCVTGVPLHLAALMPLQRCDAVSRSDAGKLVWVRVVITEIAWDGSIHRQALDTSSLTEAGRWENLIEQVLAIPRPTGQPQDARSTSSIPATAPS
jgi:hypothetical protein